MRVEVLEFKKVKQPEIIIDDTIDETIIFPEKLQAAQERFAKYPVPAWIFLHKYSKKQQEEGICVCGILEQVDVEANTLLVTVTKNDAAPSEYAIRTTPEALANIVKIYLDETISLRIRPQINADNQFEYELMAIIV
jgi:hypothetical protein